MNSKKKLNQESKSTLSKEGKITVLNLLKNFYNESIFNILIKEFYNSDVDISLTAIKASASLGNEFAIPHLYRILERGRNEQQIAAIQTLADINAPSTIEKMAKYFNIFQELDIRREILKAINKTSALHPKARELNKSILLDPKESGKELFPQAIEGLVEAEQLDIIQPYIEWTSPEVKLAIFNRLLLSTTREAGAFIQSLREMAREFTPETLGCYLCAYELKTVNPQQTFVLDLLQNTDRNTPAAFLSSLSDYNGRIPNPTQIYKILLRIPYIDPQAEALNGDLMIKIVNEVKAQAPQHFNELIFTTATHLETVFSKAKRQYLSLKGIKEKNALLTILLAQTLELYSSPNLLLELQQFFKAETAENPVLMVNKVKDYLHFAPEEDKHRFDACIPLFNITNRKVRLQISFTLSKINLNRPSLLRRLNRLTRVIGTLEIRTSAKKILEILNFSRQERIRFLEQTCVVTLCQLQNRSVIEQAKNILGDPLSNLPSLNGYLRGARFLPPKIFINTLLKLLLIPKLDTYSRSLIIDTLKHMPLRNLKGILPPLVKSLDMAECDLEQKTQIAEVLSRYGDATLLQPLLASAANSETMVRKLSISILKNIAINEKNIPLDVLTNRFYLFLEDEDKEIQVEALQSLLALGDDYAVQILIDYFNSKDKEIIIKLLKNLEASVSTEVLSLVLRLIYSDQKAVQETLREVLPAFCQGNSSEEIRENLIQSLESGKIEIVPKAQRVIPADQSDDLIEHAKLEFKFRRENSQVLTVFFIDIVSYTEKSSEADTSTIIKLIQVFEEIAISSINRFKGNLIKSSGDGLLVTFKHPLNGALTAITIQEKIAEYNQYKVDEQKFNVRMGLNTGLVIRRDRDIYGDTVNVASRMESAANPGDILLTQNTYNEVKDYIRCTRLGDIQVKGKKEAITAYSAEKIMVDIEKVLKAKDSQLLTTARKANPLERLKESTFTPEYNFPKGCSLEPAVMTNLEDLFNDMTRAIEEISHDYHEEYIFKKYLQDKWNKLTEIRVEAPASSK